MAVVFTLSFAVHSRTRSLNSCLLRHLPVLTTLFPIQDNKEFIDNCCHFAEIILLAKDRKRDLLAQFP